MTEQDQPHPNEALQHPLNPEQAVMPIPEHRVHKGTFELSDQPIGISEEFRLASRVSMGEDVMASAEVVGIINVDPDGSSSSRLGAIKLTREDNGEVSYLIGGMQKDQEGNLSFKNVDETEEPDETNKVFPTGPLAAGQRLLIGRDSRVEGNDHVWGVDQFTGEKAAGTVSRLHGEFVVTEDGKLNYVDKSTNGSAVEAYERQKTPGAAEIGEVATEQVIDDPRPAASEPAGEQAAAEAAVEQSTEALPLSDIFASPEAFESALQNEALDRNVRGALMDIQEDWRGLQRDMKAAELWQNDILPKLSEVLQGASYSESWFRQVGDEIVLIREGLEQATYAVNNGSLEEAATVLRQLELDKRLTGLHQVLPRLTQPDEVLTKASQVQAVNEQADDMVRSMGRQLEERISDEQLNDFVRQMADKIAGGASLDDLKSEISQKLAAAAEIPRWSGRTQAVQEVTAFLKQGGSPIEERAAASALQSLELFSEEAMRGRVDQELLTKLVHGNVLDGLSESLKTKVDNLMRARDLNSQIK